MSAVVKAADDFPWNHALWTQAVVAKTGFNQKTVALGEDHVVLDWKLYPDRLAVLAHAVSAAGLVKQAPADAAVQRYFDTSFLTKATGKSVHDVTH